MAGVDSTDDSLYPIAVLIDELRNEDVQVVPRLLFHFAYKRKQLALYVLFVKVLTFLFTATGQK